jgi:hydrogenase nickel incorporation protein HypB
VKKIHVVKNILEHNDAIAEENRTRLRSADVLTVNITSAPGSGKTTLLERTLPALTERGLPPAVIVGDLQTTRDAERLNASEAPIVQINTEGGCHLSATQVAEAIDHLDLDALSVIFIENVGNMVCPAGFDLGEHRRVAMLSTPEGPDKVAKYPTLFQPADLVLLNKMDLAEALAFSDQTVRDDLARLTTRAPLLRISSRTGLGVDAWLDWLVEQHAGLSE